MDPTQGTDNVDGTSELSESPELTVADNATDASPGPQEPVGETPTTEINPAWLGLRDAIGEDHFEQFAKPILSDMDRNAQQRITSLNAQLKDYESYKPLIEQGLEPDYVTQAVQIAQMLENDPEQLYNFLTQHLGKDASEEEDAEEEGLDDTEEGNIPPEVRAQIDQLRQFQEQQLQAQQEQEFNAEVERLNAEIERETREYIQNNPTWTEEDIPELDRIRYELTKELQEQGLNRIASLDEAAAVLQKRYDSYRQRFGAGAPNTLPTSAGGDVTDSKPFNPATASRKSLEAQVVNDLLSLNSDS